MFVQVSHHHHLSLSPPHTTIHHHYPPPPSTTTIHHHPPPLSTTTIHHHHPPPSSNDHHQMTTGPVFCSVSRDTYSILVQSSLDRDGEKKRIAMGKKKRIAMGEKKDRDGKKKSIRTLNVHSSIHELEELPSVSISSIRLIIPKKVMYDLM